jgi:hypothetical protein
MTITQTHGTMARRAALVALSALCATPALAQSTAARRTCGSAGSWSQLFTTTASDFRQLPSRESLSILAVGAAAALGSHTADDATLREVSETTSKTPYKPGAVIGGTPFQMGAAVATYGLGRALNKPCAASVGADLFSAQLMAQTLTIGIKAATRRSRPEGSGYSFPSGHTTVSFASATVLQRHFGWKVGLPAYAAATYIAASRVEMKKHYLSDVAFGAALGIVAGRTVTIGGGRLMLSPMASPHGAGATFTWLGKTTSTAVP